MKKGYFLAVLGLSGSLLASDYRGHQSEDGKSEKMPLLNKQPEKKQSHFGQLGKRALNGLKETFTPYHADHKIDWKMTRKLIDKLEKENYILRGQAELAGKGNPLLMKVKVDYYGLEVECLFLDFHT